MRKEIAVLLALIICVFSAGCSSNESSETHNQTQISTVQTQTDQLQTSQVSSTDLTTKGNETTVEPTTVQEFVNEAEDSDYNVVISKSVNGDILTPKNITISFAYNELLREEALKIAGDMSYSREMTKEEVDGMYHGGEVYNSNGYQNENMNNHSTFFSDDKTFEVCVAKSVIEKGSYYISLHQLFGATEKADSLEGGLSDECRIYFTIN